MPESDEYRVTKFGADVMCLFGVLFLIHAGYVAFGVDLPPAIWSTVVLFPWAAAVVLMVVAVSPIDPREHGETIAFIVVVAILAGDLAVTYSKAPGVFEFGTDTLLFSRRAVDLLVTGTNPYATSMTPVPYGYTAQMTALVNGGHVSSFSYPAGAVLVFLPQRLAGIGKFPLHLTPVVFTLASLLVLIVVSPSEIAMVPPLIYGALGLFTDATGGIIDAIWLVPLLGCMYCVAGRSWGRAGLWFGTAAAMKQQPWLIAPFLLVWALQEGDGIQWRRGTRLVAGSIVTFTAINLPFILWNPAAWLAGVFTPVYNTDAASLISQGVGLAILRFSGWMMVPKPVFSAAVATVALGGLLVYSRLPAGWRWVAFLMPPVILFVHWRSLPSYFIWYVPVAYMAVLGAYDALPHRLPRAAAFIPGGIGYGS